MPLASCQGCYRILDIPGKPQSYKQPNGQCAKCNGVEIKVHIPSEVVHAVAPGKVIRRAPSQPDAPPRVEISAQPMMVQCGVPMASKGGRKKAEAKQYLGEYPFHELKPPKSASELYSFFAPCPEGSSMKLHAGRVGAKMQYYKATFGKKQTFTVRTTKEKGVKGVRVYRLT